MILPRMWVSRIVTVCAVGAAMLVVPAVDAAPRSTPRAESVTVLARPGQVAKAAAALRARGFRVDRRVGRRLQVVVRSAADRRRLPVLPGVADVVTPPSSYGDAVVSQGVDRTGASALADAADGGAGLKIAVLDLGFGGDLATLQVRGELPPPQRLALQSFDPARGLIGANAYGGPTDHGQLVAQTVYDYVPRANYLFVNYHTPHDFSAAVDWLIGQDVDVVVHSNNFLEGPFDGTSRVAQAVNRAAAAGILWFNSAGNYGEKHLDLPWVDADSDDVLDWPGATPWTLQRTDIEALTFHLSWRNPPGVVPSDVDLALERKRDDGGWDVVATSEDRQPAGAAPAERINGYRSAVPGEFRLRAILISGPPPGGVMTLFSREDDIVDLSGSNARSIPTPADAAGSISVGALDWRSNSLVRYSSRGPTADGRRKPDLTAPTGTRLATPGGDPRDVGGTSIAAPNAAGAAAVLLATLRAGGATPSVAQVRSILARDAFDIGEPGWDFTFGAGRVRVDLDPPELRPVESPPGRPVRRKLRLSVEAADTGPVATWAVTLDGAGVALGRVAREVIATTIDTTALADGGHTASIEVRDAVGNAARRTFRFTVDNTAPVLEPVVADVLRTRRRPDQVAKDVRHRVRVRIAASDAGSPTSEATVVLASAVSGRTVAQRIVSVQAGGPRAFVIARVPDGVYVLRVSVRDRAGNLARQTQGVRIKGGIRR